MDNQKFIDYLRSTKKPARTILNYQNLVKVYHDYLRSERQINDLEQACPADLEAFTIWGKTEFKNVYRYLSAVKAFYSSIQSELLANTACMLAEAVQNDTRRLGEFPKVDQECVKKLSKIGIKTVNQLLEVDQDPKSLQGLADQIDTPLESISELVKLSNLSRLPGLKKVRGRLFYEAGLDSLQKIASLLPEQLCQLLEDYVHQSGYEGAAPVLSEAEYTIKIATFMAAQSIPEKT